MNGRKPLVFLKTYVTPRRPYEEARLDQELKIIGEYGLRHQREVWLVMYALAKIRKAARELMTLDEKDGRRLFQDNALLRRKIDFSLKSPFGGGHTGRVRRKILKKNTGSGAAAEEEEY